jgi:hypothetical protein
MFFSPCRQMPASYLKLGHDHLTSHPVFQRYATGTFADNYPSYTENVCRGMAVEPVMTF